MSSDDESGIWVLLCDEFIIQLSMLTLGLGGLLNIYNAFVTILPSDFKLIFIAIMQFLFVHLFS